VSSLTLGRILVIDDEEQIRALTRRMLEAAGYDVQEAHSGKAALASVRQQRPDVIITDIAMPDMEGLELIGALRSADPDAKIIAMSGGGTQGPTDYLVLALKYGALRVLPKPFTKATLVAVVNDVLAT
jgi:CheY-like chemotaxis protein